MNLEYYIQKIQPLLSDDKGWGIINDISSWEGWIMLIVGLLFFAVSVLLLWVYFNCQSSKNSLINSVQDRSPWSFAGFWGRYRSNIIVFGCVLFIILGASFVYSGLTGFQTVSDF